MIYFQYFFDIEIEKRNRKHSRLISPREQLLYNNYFLKIQQNKKNFTVSNKLKKNRENNLSFNKLVSSEC